MTQVNDVNSCKKMNENKNWLSWNSIKSEVVADSNYLSNRILWMNEDQIVKNSNKHLKQFLKFNFVWLTFCMRLELAIMTSGLPNLPSTSSMAALFIIFVAWLKKFCKQRISQQEKSACKFPNKVINRTTCINIFLIFTLRKVSMSKRASYLRDESRKHRISRFDWKPNDFVRNV